MKTGILLLFSFSQGKIWLKTMRKQRNCFLLQEEENKMNEIRKDIRMNYIENFS